MHNFQPPWWIWLAFLQWTGEALGMGDSGPSRRHSMTTPLHQRRQTRRNIVAADGQRVAVTVIRGSGLRPKRRRSWPAPGWRLKLADGALRAGKGAEKEANCCGARQPMSLG